MNKFAEILNRISDHLKNVDYINGDWSDIGNEIGIAVGKERNTSTTPFDINDLISGIRHGISLEDGTHDQPQKLDVCVDENPQKCDQIIFLMDWAKMTLTEINTLTDDERLSLYKFFLNRKKKHDESYEIVQRLGEQFIKTLTYHGK